MKVMSFHLMPYADLDLSVKEKYRTVWIVLPNSYYDPKKGHALYNRYLDELELCAELGFDGVCVNEHHQNAYGLMPSPVVMASALSRRTRDCRIAILGNAFCLREHPLTLAEEHAMIDVITGGRLISGFVRGVGSEYFSFGTNPVYSLERHQEAHDLVVQAWTRPGPFAFEGKHYHCEYVNLWPRPYQQPHPPIWCPSMGSVETLEWAAHPDRKYVYLQAYSPVESVARYLNLYRELAQRRYGYEASSDRIGWSTPIYVAETDERARVEAGRAVETLFNDFLRQSFEMLMPPGYTSMRSMKNFIAMRRGLGGGRATAEGLIESGTALIGSPETVRVGIERMRERTGFGILVALLQFGILSDALTRRNMDLFAAEVMPHLRD